MLQGEKTILREMRAEDVLRQHEFNQDIELYGLDSSFPRPSSLEQAQAAYEDSVKNADEDSAWFAIEADGKYIGNCCLMGAQPAARHSRTGDCDRRPPVLGARLRARRHEAAAALWLSLPGGAADCVNHPRQE